MGKVIFLTEDKGGCSMSVSSLEVKKTTKKAVDIAKIILFFANESTYKLYKTKLNKLLFYVQFLYYKKYEEELLNEVFLRDHYGPVLDNLDQYLDILKRANLIELKRNIYGTIVEPLEQLPSTEYDPKELKVLKKVQEQFDSYTAKGISEYSHLEDVWINTPQKNILDIKGSLTLHEF